MKLFTVRTDLGEIGFVFMHADQIFPKIRAEITAHLMFEFTKPAFDKWKKLSEKEQKDLIRTVAQKELKVEDLIVGIIDEYT